MRSAAKDWDAHVLQAEEVARLPGFQGLRDRIVDKAQPRRADRVVDVGAGTGLLTLALADRVAEVWAIDISPAMCEYLRTKAASAGHGNVRTAVASAASLPLVDQSADLVVSNYCLHHLDDEGKLRALREMHRVLVPGGRLVFADMMFRPSLAETRDRRVVSSKVRALLGKGPSGALRLAKNGARFAAARWEKPARPQWWQRALEETGFIRVEVQPLAHEGGVAVAARPAIGG